MKKIKFFEVLALIAVISLTVLAGVSCSKAQASESQKLTGVTWVLKSFGDPANLTPAVADVETTLQFIADKKEVSGNGGVNGYGGNYAVNKDQLFVSGVVHTMMASLDEKVMGQENAFFKILESSKSFKIEGKQLTITGTEGALVFTQK